MENMPRRNRRMISIDGFIAPAQPRKRPAGVRPTQQAAAPKTIDGQLRPRQTPVLASSNFATPTRQLPELKKQPTQKTKKYHSKKSIFKRGALVAMAALLVVGGWPAWKLYQNIAKVTNNNNPLSLLSAFQPVELKGEKDGRVNILVAGNSDDDPGHNGAKLTDSIMILSVNTRDKSAFMLSVPRDLWVSVPTMGHQKINAAATVESFKANGYPDGGMGQLEQVIKENLGITTHYYALINYTAFRDAVNAVGGITVDIQSTDTRGLYDPNIAKVDGGPLKLTNGAQNLDGQTALNLARARGDHYRAYGFPGSDFDRTAHQRQMLLALKTKAASSSVLSDPLKIGKLADALGNNVQTDMKLNEMETLFSMTKGLSDGSIESFNINNINGKQLLANYTASNGQSALAPAAGVDDFSDIELAIKKLTSTDPLVKEAATATVLNGSQVNGLAKRQSDSLETKGLTVLAMGQAATAYPKTTLIDNSAGKKPGTLAALQKYYGVTATKDAALQANYPNAQFIIVLGSDYKDTSTSTSTTTTN